VNSYDVGEIANPEFELAAAPSKLGLTFVAYETPNSERYAPGDRLVISANTTVKALWQEVLPVSYLISYDANGGENAPMPQSKTEDMTLVLSDVEPTRAGYVFLGWADNETTTTAQYQPGGNYTKNETATLYAVWRPVNYEVRFNENGGTGITLSQKLDYGQSAHLTTNAFTKSGYSFVGWGYTPDGEAVFADEETVLNLTIADGTVIDLFAIWQENPPLPPTTYTIAYDANGGTGAPAAQTKTQGIALALSSVASTRTGHGFQGWATSKTAANAQCQPGGSYTADGSATLYAVWKENTVTPLTPDPKPEPPPSSDPQKHIFSTKYLSVWYNWILFFLGFGWIWMWF
jgi:uncharacterized repeat protein (TIGR02543 family)